MKLIKRLLLLVLPMSFIGSVPVMAIPENITPKLNEQLAENSHRYGVVSQSVLILKEGEVIFNGIHGSANLSLSVSASHESVYPVYSVAKLFTSVLLMQLVEKGLVELESPIGDYLTTLPKPWRPIAVKHFLNHTSGVPEYFSLELLKRGFLDSKQSVFDALANEPFQFETGALTRYNNTNYLLLAAVIEKLTDRSLRQLATNNIISTLNLKNTGFASAQKIIPAMVTSYQGTNGEWRIDPGVDWPEYTFSHSGLYSTAQELAIFLTAVEQGKLLKPETLAQMWQPLMRNNGTPGWFASGWEYSANESYTQVGHDGGNRVRLRHFYSSKPEQSNYTVVYLTNGSAHGVWTSVLIDSVISIVEPGAFPKQVAAELLIDKLFDAANQKSLDDDAILKKLSKLVPEAQLEQLVNQTAYAMLYGAGVDRALPLFQLNTRLFPQSANVWDSLAEAWLTKANKANAIANFQKALALDPNLASAKAQLANLSD